MSHASEAQNKHPLQLEPSGSNH